jgi:hypothetical protein
MVRSEDANWIDQERDERDLALWFRQELENNNNGYFLQLSTLVTN